ncbi:MAG: hypothetical protein KBG40_08800 [Bacteroidales bacterium]|nr:hypothetical protein [Bacteroidales bacterium]
MKNIDEIIRENRNLFDDKEPMEGHFERFEWKLQKRLHPPANKRDILPYLLRAAIITAFISLSSVWIWNNYLRPGKDQMTLGDVSPQYKEVENYYLREVSTMKDELNKAEFRLSPEQKNMLNSELKSMDSIYIQLQKDLKANPNDERIINSMIEHYQIKVEVMSYILNQLKAIKDENQKTGENEKFSI